MPKPGYVALTLKSEVARILRLKASQRGMGINQYLLWLMKTESRPGTVPERSPFLASFWCGEWDSNPRTPTGQAPEACAFDLAWLSPHSLLAILVEKLKINSYEPGFMRLP